MPARALLARWDSRDTPYFPQRGAEVAFDAFYGNATQRIGDAPEQTYNNLGRSTLYANVGVPIDANDFLNVAVRGGALSRDVPRSSIRTCWAASSTFRACAPASSRGATSGSGASSTITGSPGSRILGGELYAGGSLEAGNTWQTRNDASASDLITAGSVFLGADTFLGPLYFAYGRASGGASSFY